MGKGSRSNKSKGKDIDKNWSKRKMVMKKSKKSKKEHRKKKIKASLVAKTSEMLSSPSMQKLLLSAMLRSMNKSPPSPDKSSSDSSDCSDWGPLTSPATSDDEVDMGDLQGEPKTYQQTNCLNPNSEMGDKQTNMPSSPLSSSEVPQEVNKDGSGGQISLPTAPDSCPPLPKPTENNHPVPPPSTQEDITVIQREGEWMTANHSLSPRPESPHNTAPPPEITVSDDDDDALVVEVDDDDLILDSEDDGGCPGSTQATRRSRNPDLEDPMCQPPSSSCAPPPAPRGPPNNPPANLPEAIPRTFPASTFLDNGLVKLRFDRLASPFQVRNQIVERSLHKEISFDIQKIKDQATNIRPCIPFQNLSCHRIVPVHGSMSTDLVFSHVCLLCLFSEGLPLPHAMVHCPFSSTLEPPNNN